MFSSYVLVTTVNIALEQKVRFGNPGDGALVRPNVLPPLNKAHAGNPGERGILVFFYLMPKTREKAPIGNSTLESGLTMSRVYPYCVFYFSSIPLACVSLSPGVGVGRLSSPAPGNPWHFLARQVQPSLRS